MFTKSLLTLGVVAAMTLSMSGAFARDFDHRNDYRNDHREMRHDRGGRGEHRGFEHGGRGEHRGSNGHNFGSGGRGHR